MPPTILEKIVEQKRRDLELLQSERPLSALITEVERGCTESLPFFETLNKTNGTNIIAEIKRFSPSKGPLRPDLDPIKLASAYAVGGARAISVLTEEKFFHGSSDDLRKVRENVDIPILRKDFTIDKYQLWEAKLLGASAILLIACVLTDKQMADLYKLSQELALDTLIEVHNAEEVRRVLALRPKILGVNNRNLHNFEVSLNVSKQLIREFKMADVSFWVSESGIHKKEHIEELEECGFKSFLIGESLLKADNPVDQLKELLS